MKDLKRLVDAVLQTVPKEDTVGVGRLVCPEEVEDELKEIREKSKLVEKLKDYKTVDDIFGDFSPEAARRLVYEMHYGKTSNDKRAAAKEVLDRHLGKPVDRVFNVTADVSQMSDQEMDNQIEELMHGLGYKKREGETSKKLIIEESSERPESAERAQSESGVSGQI